jgi:hypothetical protein
MLWLKCGHWFSGNEINEEFLKTYEAFHCIRDDREEGSADFKVLNNKEFRDVYSPSTVRRVLKLLCGGMSMQFGWGKRKIQTQFW